VVVVVVVVCAVVMSDSYHRDCGRCSCRGIPRSGKHYVFLINRSINQSIDLSIDRYIKPER